MAVTLDRVSVAEGREPSGFAAFTGRSPDGSRLICCLRGTLAESDLALAPFRYVDVGVGSRHRSALRHGLSLQES
jgi:hypothetical protein